MPAPETPENDHSAIALLEFFKQDRRWVALEIHDGFVQETTAALMFLEAASRDLDAGRQDDAATALQQSITLLRKAILESRALINGLRPPELETLGLRGALESLCHELGIAAGPTFTLHCDDLPSIGDDLQTALYRIAQEGLTNAGKHSQAKQVELKLSTEGNSIVLLVDDDGVGRSESTLKPLAGVGLKGIHERVAALGGQSEFGHGRLGGSRLRVVIPVRL